MGRIYLSRGDILLTSIIVGCERDGHLRRYRIRGVGPSELDPSAVASYP